MIRCQTPVSAEVKCNTPLKYDWMGEKWLHDAAPSSYTDHPVTVPEGTERPKNLIEELMEETVGKYEKARAKYEPLVKNLTDMDFVGLYRVVMEERTRRMAILIATNPAVRDMAIADLKRQIAAEGN